jgi:UDP-N-acetylmuramate dehydrogenase
LNKSIYKDLKQLLQGEILEKIILKRKTTYQIGGEASLYVCPNNSEDLRCLNSYLVQNDLPRFVLGGGANVLISDRGFRGVVIHLKEFVQLSFSGSTVVGGAGLVLDDFIVTCLRNGYRGLENLSGIPGSLGGALRMNAGAFGAEISDYLISVKCMDYQGNFKVLSRSEVNFSYRKAPHLQNMYILEAKFKFPCAKKETLFIVREEILNQRRKRQPWQYPTAGSVFKRPPGYYAGELIEKAGLKGKRIGRAEISRKHAGIIINLGGATATDVLELIQLIRSTVLENFRINLELEQELVGFDQADLIS